MSVSPMITTADSDVERQSRGVVRCNSHSIKEYPARWDTPMALGRVADGKRARTRHDVVDEKTLTS